MGERPLIRLTPAADRLDVGFTTYGSELVDGEIRHFSEIHSTAECHAWRGSMGAALTLRGVVAAVSNRDAVLCGECC
jgi:hypothetical protein